MKSQKFGQGDSGKHRTQSVQGVDHIHPSGSIKNGQYGKQPKKGNAVMKSDVKVPYRESC